ncbi:MAG: cysteine-rich CWC family protein [Bacteroidales bacterium]|jgi:hypothetical protein|nr:cysteine-rich CWC family protein [Bacteroidales bacterium]
MNSVVEIKTCPRCGYKFECRHGDIVNCHCSSVVLDVLMHTYIKLNYADCLCHDCLSTVHDAFSVSLLGNGSQHTAYV